MRGSMWQGNPWGWDFLGGPVVRNLPAKFDPWSKKIPHAAGQLSLHDRTTETVQRQLEKAHTQKQRPTAVKTQKKNKTKKHQGWRQADRWRNSIPLLFSYRPWALGVTTSQSENRYNTTHLMGLLWVASCITLSTASNSAKDRPGLHKRWLSQVTIKIGAYQCCSQKQQLLLPIREMLPTLMDRTALCV